jgi:DNA repair protein RadC
MCRIETILIREKKEAFNIQTCSAREVYNVFKFMADRPQESLYIVCLNSKNRIIGYSELAKGRLNTCALDMRELARIPILVNAASVIILHNHPSGDSHPSRDDIAITQKARDSLALFGIKLLDHIIIGDENFTSLLEKGHLRDMEVKQ